MTRHVVFGAGQVGAHLIDQLAAEGQEVVAISRSGRAVVNAISVAGDATDPSFTTRVTKGADVAYFCLNAPDYSRWAEEFPPLQRGVLAGAEAAGARLVVLDNLYAYGPTHGEALVETMPTRPTSTKAATRAAMTAELLEAHRVGRVEVAIGRATRRLAATGMAGAATLAIAGFTALGSIFDYPKILKEPTAEILARFREHQGAIRAWFFVLVVSAALLAPVGILLGRIAKGPLGPWIAGTGIAAAAVQVIGLSRWVLLIPRVSDDATIPSRTADAQHTFELLHTWLGEALGETVGYALTATFTVLVVKAITGPMAPRWMTYLGYAAAALIATGVLIPLGLDGLSITNFVGYVAWCAWLIAMALILWRSPVDVPPTAGDRQSTAPQEIHAVP